jgi:hypothetical protein
MNKHPANNGKVMLSIWVEAPLRDYVRARALEAKQPVSEWAGNALRMAVLNTSLGAFCFPPEHVPPGDYYPLECNRLRAELARLSEIIARIAPCRCPTCGPGVRIDEDGCCATCGSDTVWAK